MKPRAKTFWLSRGRPFSRTHYSHSFGVSTCHLQAHLAQDTVKTTKRYFSSIQFFTLRFLFTDNKSRTTHIQVGTRWCRKQISQARTPGENEAFTPAQQTQIDFGKQEYICRPRGRNLHIVATCATHGPFLGRRSRRLAACAAVSRSSGAAPRPRNVFRYLVRHPLKPHMYTLCDPPACAPDTPSQ